jgi:CRISPR-associated protein Cas1
MRTVYVNHRGAVVRREGNVLHVFAERRKVAEVQAHDLQQLVLMGNVVLTPAALDLLVERGVDTVFLTLHGKYRARIAHSQSSQVSLRLAQYRRLVWEPGPALEAARAIVRGKMSNARALLLRWARRHGETPGLQRAALALRAGMERLGLARTLDEVRGCEGSTAAAYFRAFGELIRADGFHFDGRSRRPPMDPLNALLSLGYTLLANAVEAAVEVVGLDPFVGALHAPAAGRPSLVCDLVEEFRAPVVDALVAASVNKGAIGVDDFEEIGPEEPVVVRREALGTFVGLFERRLDSQAIYAPFGKRLSYRQIIEQQARRFARFVLGDEPGYEPYLVR